MGVLSNRIDREELKPGDHIYSWREAYIYAHHGIYVGEGKVVHFTREDQQIGTGTFLDRFIWSSGRTHSAHNPCPNCGDQSRVHGVISSCLDCFLFGGHLCRFEYDVWLPYFIAQARGGTCLPVPSDPPEDVLHRARYLLQNGFGAYDVFKNNCEDYAIYCKTGLLMGQSGQAASFEAAIDALSRLTTGFSGPALVRCGMSYCISRLSSGIRMRRHVAKVPVERLIDPSGLNEPASTNESERPTDPSGLNEPASTNESERPTDPPGLHEPASTSESERPTDPPSLDESASTSESERPKDPPGLDESASTSESKRPKDPPGLDESAKANNEVTN